MGELRERERMIELRERARASSERDREIASELREGRAIELTQRTIEL